MTNTYQLDEAILRTKKVVELREIARAFGILYYQKLKKAELLEALINGLQAVAGEITEKGPETQQTAEAGEG